MRACQGSPPTDRAGTQIHLAHSTKSKIARFEQRKLRAEEAAQVEGPKKQKPPEGGFHRQYLMRSRGRLADLPVVRPPNNDWSCSVT